MNKQQIAINRNKSKLSIRISNRTKNVLRWSSGETKAHVYMKLEICNWLKEQGKEFYTEAIFLNGSRCDVLNADNLIIYEVLNSEKEDNIELKKGYYPEIFEIRKVNANQQFREEILL